MQSKTIVASCARRSSQRDELAGFSHSNRFQWTWGHYCTEKTMPAHECVDPICVYVCLSWWQRRQPSGWTEVWLMGPEVAEWKTWSEVRQAYFATRQNKNNKKRSQELGLHSIGLHRYSRWSIRLPSCFGTLGTSLNCPGSAGGLMASTCGHDP